MLTSSTIISCTKAHGISSVLLFTRLWEAVISFGSSHEYSFIQTVFCSALLCSALRISLLKNFKASKKFGKETSRTQTASPLLLNSCKCLGCKSRREKRIQAVVALHAKEEKPLQEKATIYMKHSESPPIPPPSPSKNCLLIFPYCSKMESLPWNSSFSSLRELT